MATATITGTRHGAVAEEQPGSSLQGAGGVAALLAALITLASIVLFLVVQPAMGLPDSTWDHPARAVQFVVTHQGYFTFVGLLLLAGALPVPVLVLALYARMRSLSPGVVSVAALFGVIAAAMQLLNGAGQLAEFATFASLPQAVAAQAEPYGNVAYLATSSATSVALGTWVLLLAAVVVRRGGLPKWLGYFGIFLAIAQFLMVAGLPIGPLVGIPWLVGVGIALLRSPRPMVQSEL